MVYKVVIETKIVLSKYTPSGKECWEKPQKCMCMSNVLAFFQAWEDLPKFDTTAGYSYHSSIFS